MCSDFPADDKPFLLDSTDKVKMVYIVKIHKNKQSLLAIINTGEISRGKGFGLEFPFEREETSLPSFAQRLSQLLMAFSPEDK